ncbi:hypothetical protein DPMN_039686 [Dreissena polymorpha]|uniref:Uncharacterized protein n=1 Tax=Dreissena polymorpha TaxID=45954 RepID=A0A9D4CTP2_DREPO|nr:hypothetical protein DPMN_039686 [Dreissena polymorpha]
MGTERGHNRFYNNRASVAECAYRSKDTRKAGSPHRSYVEQSDHVGFGKNESGWPIADRRYTWEQCCRRGKLFTHDRQRDGLGLDKEAQHPQYYAYPFGNEY